MPKFKRFESSNKKKDKCKSIQREDSFAKVAKTDTKYKMKWSDYEEEFPAQAYGLRVH